MENLYKRSAEWVTRWESKLRRDEFFVTRVRLTVLYTLLAVVFLCAFSYVLYGSLLSRLTDSAKDTILDPAVRGLVLSKAEGIIRNLIFLGDSVVLVIVVVVGFFLTKKTLEPIQTFIKKQERFIADASHELRTPLAVMKTGIEVSLRKKDLSAEESRKIISDTLKEVNLLTALSNDLLAYSRGHVSNITFTKIYLPDILARKVERMKHVLDEKHIHLSLTGHADKKMLISGNDFMLSQAFYNLIHNAIIYTSDGGSVSVNYSIDRKGKYFVVAISDTGVGISKENLPHIFEPFYRAKSGDGTHGSGLGLSIVKSHLDLHNGHIDVQSEIGKGTVVKVALPLVV